MRNPGKIVSSDRHVFVTICNLAEFLMPDYGLVKDWQANFSRQEHRVPR